MDENRIKMYLDNLANTYSERDSILAAKKPDGEPSAQIRTV